MSVSPRAISTLLVLAIAVLADGTASAQGRRSKLDRALQEVVRSAGRGSQRVIVQTRPGAREQVKRALRTHGDVVLAEHPSLDALTVNLHREDLAALAADPSVLAVSIDAEVTSFAKAAAAKAGGRGYSINTLRTSLGLDGTRADGTGVNVAIIDSGIAPTRDLRNSIGGFWDFTRGGVPVAAYDDYGHGTHIAGLIASSGAETGLEYTGVAPGARLFGFKVLDKFGRGRASDVVRALEYIAANKRSTAPGALKIDIVNLSLGHPVYEPAATDPLVRAVESLVRAGVVVVAAAGNHGIDSNGSTGFAGITSPGNAPSALTVGAVDTKNTGTRIDDRVAAFSSRGPSWFDGFAKPEVVAPGVALASDAPDGSELYNAYPQLRLPGRDRKLARLSGTSMAAATATGVAALVLQTSRSVNDGEQLTANTVKAVLQYTAIPVEQADGTPFTALAQGAGQINGRGAIALAWLINTRIAAGQPWLRLPLLPVSLIDGRLHAWSRALVWDDAVIHGSNAIYINSQLWDDNIVWGTGCDTDDAQCLATVWGAAADVDNIVWGTGLAWAADLVFPDRVVGFFAGDDNIVWGTLAGLGEDNIVWGTVIGDDNIVWGTLRGDNIVWGTVRGDDNIVWGTWGADNIVWGTWGADDIVWGTMAGLDGDRR